VAASAMNSVSLGSFTSGANSARKSTSAVAPRPPAMPFTVRCMASSIRFMVLELKVRTVPRRTAVCGMTL
jgi:hypothetical protein